jgi:hypothetical protein
MTLIKGPYVLFSFILFALGYVFSKERWNQIKLFLSYILLIAVINILIIFAYEKFYLHITGEGFLNTFYAIQFKQRVLDIEDKHSFIIQRIFNFWYYFYHCVLYALPWSLVSLFVIIKKFIAKNKGPILFYNSQLSYLLIGATLVFCGIFGMSNRIAGRYVYPAYYFSACWFFLFSFFNLTSLQKIHSKLFKNIFPYFVTSLWLLAFVIQFI